MFYTAWERGYISSKATHRYKEGPGGACKFSLLSSTPQPLFFSFLNSPSADYLLSVDLYHEIPTFRAQGRGTIATKHSSFFHLFIYLSFNLIDYTNPEGSTCISRWHSLWEELQSRPNNPKNTTDHDSCVITQSWANASFVWRKAEQTCS